MYLVARLLKRFVKEAERLHPVELVKDYDRTIMGELNLLLEADNTAKLRENWLGSGKLYVPKVYHEFSRTNVMVMERVYGVTATNLDALRARGVNLKKLAHLGVEIFFTQVFDHNFFHADMHPGNVFVDTSDPENPTYIALDCAIIGTLTESDQRYLARNLLAFFHRDYDEVARLHIQSGWVPPDTDEREFAAVITAVCDPIFQKPIKDISFGLLLVSLFQTARQFNMEVQPQLVLLQKTLINIEGMGRQIYPDLNLWETAEPFMDNWMKQRVGLTSLLNRIMERAPAWLEQLPEAPDFLLEALQEAGRLGEHRRRQEQTLQQVQAALQGQAKRHRYERLGGAALVAGLLSLLAPATGLASPTEALLPGALLGSLGVYWLYIHS